MPFQHQVVEGEPGIFPDPVARVLRVVGGLFGRWSGRSEKAPDPDEPSEPTEIEREPQTEAEPETESDKPD